HLQRHVRHRERLHALDRLVEHLLREVDPREPAGGGIERQVQAGADADLEHRVLARQPEMSDGGFASGREDPVEDEIVGGGPILVRALYLMFFERYVHACPPWQKPRFETGTGSQMPAYSTRP